MIINDRSITKNPHYMPNHFWPPEDALIKFFSFLEERGLVKKYIEYLYEVVGTISYIETFCMQDYPEGLLDEILREGECPIPPEEIPRWRALSDEWKAIVYIERTSHHE